MDMKVSTYLISTLFIEPLNPRVCEKGAEFEQTISTRFFRMQLLVYIQIEQLSPYEIWALILILCKAYVTDYQHFDSLGQNQKP